MSSPASPASTAPVIQPLAPAAPAPANESLEPSPQQQAAGLLGHVAGYLAHRVVELGLRRGLFAAIDAAPGSDCADLAEALGLDAFYLSVWCRAAFGAGLLERTGTGFRLAPHLASLLLDSESPAYLGALFPLMLEPELFDRFGEHLDDGERLWWDGVSPQFLAGVSATGRPFYRRLIPSGLQQVPGLSDRLAAGGRVVEHACGAGVGLVALAEAFPNVRVVGVDGDAASVGLALERVGRAGLADRVTVMHSPLEAFTSEEPVTVVLNNISMHECRDVDEVTRRVFDALEPGGWFVVSDFPFPDTDEGLRTIAGRVMSGIQFFEAQIDDQLQPRAAYDDLLARHGFVEPGWFSLGAVHAVTYGRRPAST